jgi:ABC-type sugar transport system permease subunit
MSYDMKKNISDTVMVCLAVVFTIATLYNFAGAMTSMTEGNFSDWDPASNVTSTGQPYPDICFEEDLSEEEKAYRNTLECPTYPKCISLTALFFVCALACGVVIALISSFSCQGADRMCGVYIMYFMFTFASLFVVLLAVFIFVLNKDVSYDGTPYTSCREFYTDNAFEMVVMAYISLSILTLPIIIDVCVLIVTVLIGISTFCYALYHCCFPEKSFKQDHPHSVNWS